VLQGVGVSPGIVLGKVHVLVTEDEAVIERDITDEEVPREISRFQYALIATRHQIHAIQKQVAEALDQSSASIFDAHLLVVDDAAFVDEVIRGLRTNLKNAESVLKRVAERYAGVLASLEDDYLRERATDVRDVARRILRNLSGDTVATLANLEEPCIIIAHDIPPSEAATMNSRVVRGICTDVGSPSSHTAIMARAMEIPAVVGLHNISVRVSQGDEVLIDGQGGMVILHPTEEQIERFGRIQQEKIDLSSRLESLRDLKAETADGHIITLSANIELPQDVAGVTKYGAEGVGLFRTEFLYISAHDQPSESDQAAIYEKVAREIHPAPLIIRTVDLGGDKFITQVNMPKEAEANPFMGWRAIRFCLAHPDFFLKQLRAVLRASKMDNVKIMYPMISSAAEVQAANALLEQAKRELRGMEVPFNEKLEVGAMIEVPSAALTAELIAPHVSFFSIGTNDLVQYTLAVDRVNERVGYLYEPTHPAILKLIKLTTDAAHHHGIWTGVCGQMAGDPMLTPLLLGLGVDELSVSPNVTPLIKNVIRKMRMDEARKLAATALQCTTSETVNQCCLDTIRRLAPEILDFIG